MLGLQELQTLSLIDKPVLLLGGNTLVWIISWVDPFALKDGWYISFERLQEFPQFYDRIV